LALQFRQGTYGAKGVFLGEFGLLPCFDKLSTNGWLISFML